MTAATMDNDTLFQSQMKGPLVSSAVLHVLLLIFAVVGLPFLSPQLPPIEDAITVELVDASEVPETNKPPEPQKKKQPPQNTAKEPPKPQMPQVTAKKPPKPNAPTAPEKIEEFAPPDKKPEQEVKKPEKAKEIKPPKPLKRPMLTKAEEPQEEEFKSLLRNLMPNEETAAKAEEDKKAEQTPLSRFSQQMSMGELDALKRQLSQCWSVMSGARYAEDIVVDIKLFMNPDRSIRDAKIVNQLRYNTDNFFRAAADGALRAVFRCSPLDLPPNKYDLWNTITVTFDPRTML